MLPSGVAQVVHWLLTAPSGSDCDCGNKFLKYILTIARFLGPFFDPNVANASYSICFCEQAVQKLNVLTISVKNASASDHWYNSAMIRAIKTNYWL